MLSIELYGRIEVLAVVAIVTIVISLLAYAVKTQKH